MHYCESWQYKTIARYYEGKNAKRSGLPYIKHIDEGVEILNRIDADELSINGFILHPLFQGDEALNEFWKGKYVGMNRLADRINKEEILVCLEYRNMANAFLSKDVGIKKATLSPVYEVNLMLLADKVQNQADFYRYQSWQGENPTMPEEKYKRLERYFTEWRDLLTKKFPILMEQFPLDKMLETKQLRSPHDYAME